MENRIISEYKCTPLETGLLEVGTKIQLVETKKSISNYLEENQYQVYYLEPDGTIVWPSRIFDKWNLTKALDEFELRRWLRRSMKEIALLCIADRVEKMKANDKDLGSKGNILPYSVI